MIEEVWLLPFVSDAVESLDEAALAVDVGANEGTWSTMLAGRFEFVIAVEPDERASSHIPEAENVEVVNGAISDFCGQGELHLRPQALQNSLLKQHPIDGRAVVGTVEVLCQTLDSLCPEGADLVKIDIEGGEEAALRGCSGDGRWKRTHFIIECHDTFDSINMELLRLGKRVEKVPHPSIGAHPGHCWAIGTPSDDLTEPVV